MKKRLNIILAQRWALSLGHEIGEGFFDYAQTQTNWDVTCSTLSEVLEGIDHWHDLDGLVISSDPRKKHSTILNRSFPMVINYWMPENPELAQVDVDPAATGSLAADYLLTANYRRLAALSFHPKHMLAHTARIEAFAEQCHQQNQPCELFIPEDISLRGDLSDHLSASILAWIRSGDLPVAIFCSADPTAHSLLRILHKNGLHVPDDVAVLGCENDGKICRGSFPSLSSVHLPYRQVGFESARLLDALITGRTPKNRQIFLPPETVTERMSTSLFATSDAQIHRAIEFIRRHACENVSVHDVARHAGLTLDTLQHRFKQEIGHGPSKELQRMRLEKAKEMLRNTDLPLEEIAEATGYKTAHYLSRAFKEKTGKTARKYRNTYRH